MQPEVHRREFLHGCAVLSVGTLAGVGATAVPLATHAIDPVARNGVAKFKFSLAAYSYRALLTGKDPKLTLSDFIQDCAKMGLDGAELTSYYFAEPDSPEYLHGLRRQCFQLGLDISGTAIRGDFGYPEGGERRKEIADMKQWIDRIAILGAPIARIFAGDRKEGVSKAESHKLFVSGIQECCDYAGSKGVFLALENHGGPTSTAQGLLAIVRDVQSPWFGVNLDTGNFRSGNDPYGELAEVAPYALNVQVKIAMMDSNGNRTPADFKRLAKIIRDASYRGYVVLEYEGGGDPRTECPRYLERLREAFA